VDAALSSPLSAIAGQAAVTNCARLLLGTATHIVSLTSVFTSYYALLKPPSPQAPPVIASIPAC